MMLMVCWNLNVLLDTYVFVTNLLHEDSNPNVFAIIKRDGFHIVVCPPLFDEYIRQIQDRHAPLRVFLDYMMSQFHEWGILYWSEAIEQQEVRIVSRKDQPHIDCAVNPDNVVHILVTGDLDDYEFVNGPPRVPKIIHPDGFLERNTRENMCRDIQQGR